jgi:hypothetical protein
MGTSLFASPFTVHSRTTFIMQRKDGSGIILPVLASYREE